MTKKINPLIFIFLGAIVASISLGIMIIRKEYTYLIFILIGIGSLIYGFISRIKIKNEENKINEISKEHIETTPNLSTEEKLAKKMQERQSGSIQNNTIRSHKTVQTRTNNTRIGPDDISKPNIGKPHGKNVQKCCSNCHAIWQNHDYYCKRCGSRHFYYLHN